MAGGHAIDKDFLMRSVEYTSTQVKEEAIAAAADIDTADIDTADTDPHLAENTPRTRPAH